MYFAVHYHKYEEVQTSQEVVLLFSVAWSRGLRPSGPPMAPRATVTVSQADGGQDRPLKSNSSLVIKRASYTSLVPSKVNN